MARHPAILVLLEAWLVLGFVRSASAQSLEDARQHWFEAEFVPARKEFEGVLDRSDITVSQALEAHRYLAVLHLVLGDSNRARAHAEAAVALDPDVKPPEGSPPSATDLFLSAKRRLGGVAAKLTIEPVLPLVTGQPGKVRARLSPAPPALASRIQLRCDAAQASSSPATVEVEVVPKGVVHCVAQAFSSGGAVLFSVGRELLVEGAVSTQPSETGVTGEKASKHHRAAWWAVGGSLAVATVAAVIVGVLVKGNNDKVQFGGTTVMGW